MPAKLDNKYISRTLFSQENKALCSFRSNAKYTLVNSRSGKTKKTQYKFLIILINIFLPGMNLLAREDEAKSETFLGQ